MSFAVCSCLDGNLVSQHFFGGNCNMEVGCGVHGTYDPILKACKCDLGYRAVGMTCQKLPVLEQLNLLPCTSDELEVSTLDPVKDGFHADYIARLQGTKCVKRPCSFDALSGRPLKYAKHEPDWGCVCDPSKGLFGVKLEAQGLRYLNSKGFDACASILEKDPSQDLDVELVTYFYLLNREPISLIRFSHLKDPELIPMLQGQGGHFIMTQSLWRYDYVQYFMKQHPEFRAKLRRAFITPFTLDTYQFKDYYDDRFKPQPCLNLTNYLKQLPLITPFYYQALYGNPVCYVNGDNIADPIFKDRIIANPFHLSDKIPNTFEFYNAFALHYSTRLGEHRWTLDLKYPYKIDTYRAAQTNAPQYLP